MTVPAGSLARSRWVVLDGAANVRDLGGLPVHGGRHTRTGIVLRADNLQDLSDADVELLLERGLHTVIDLRSGAEVAAEGPGPLTATTVQHLHLSLVPETGRATDAGGRLSSLREDRERWLPKVREILQRHGADARLAPYLGYLRDAPHSIVAAARAVADPASGGLVLHCAAGKDRTGVTVALILDAVGVEREAVIADYAASAEVIEAVVARLASSPTYGPDLVGTTTAQHAPDPATMRALLAEVDETDGGAAAWLQAHGLTDDELSALRKRLVA
jgi:protein tyrosine/serine phosphatase